VPRGPPWPGSVLRRRDVRCHQCDHCNASAYSARPCSKRLCHVHDRNVTNYKRSRLISFRFVCRYACRYVGRLAGCRYAATGRGVRSRRLQLLCEVCVCGVCCGLGAQRLGGGGDGGMGQEGGVTCRARSPRGPLPAVAAPSAARPQQDGAVWIGLRFGLCLIVGRAISHL
jgi:hypothetical protein